MRNLDLALLRTFLAVADRASMTAAANTLHLTQGAVSQQVQRLEAVVGAPLFERRRSGLILSAKGEWLLGRARRLVALNDELCADCFGEAVEGRVRLGAPYDLAGPLAGPALKAFAEACPRVEVSLLCRSSPELIEALARGEIDLALIEQPLGATTLGDGPGEALRVERLVWVGARGGLAHARDPLPVSIVADRCAFRPAMLEALRSQPRPWRTVFDNGGLEPTMAMVRADLTITAWLASLVPADVAVLGEAAGLPPLPPFVIRLHQRPGSLDRPGLDLARLLGEQARAG